jgi:hypothetical protein
MLTVEATEKLLREDEHVFAVIVVCALNDERIRRLVAAVAQQHHRDPRDLTGFVAASRDLAEAINAHVHAHAVDSTNLSNVVVLLAEPVLSPRAH